MGRDRDETKVNYRIREYRMSAHVDYSYDLGDCYDFYGILTT